MARNSDKPADEVTGDYVGKPEFPEGAPKAGDKVKVKNISSKPVQFAFGVIPAGAEGFACYSDLCGHPDHLKAVSEPKKGPGRPTKETEE